MLITCLGLGEEISNLNLGGKVVEGDSLVTNRAPNEMSIHTNMLGQLMLGGISCNLKSPSAITVKESGRRDSYTQILQEPTELDNLLDSGSQRTELSLHTRTSNSSLLLGPPNNKRGTKKQAVASDRSARVRTACPSGIRVGL